MSCAYKPKDSQVQGASLLVQELTIPFTITHNATPANVVISCSQPSLLFLNTQGVSQITVANGAVDSSAELAGITFASPNDASGLFNALVRLNEDVCAQLVSVSVSSLNAQGTGYGYLPSAPANGITSVGNKFAFNVQMASADFATTDFNGALTIKYITAE